MSAIGCAPAAVLTSLRTLCRRGAAEATQLTHQLAAAVDAVRGALCKHMRREELEVLPLLQAHLCDAEQRSMVWQMLRVSVIDVPSCIKLEAMRCPALATSSCAQPPDAGQLHTAGDATSSSAAGYACCRGYVPPIVPLAHARWSLRATSCHLMSRPSPGVGPRLVCLLSEARCCFQASLAPRRWTTC